MGNAECPTCGDDHFKSNRGMKYHHATVHDESLSKVDLTCEWCGDDYQKFQSLVDQSEQNFCSQSCYGSWVEHEQSKEDAPRWNGGKEIVECSQCGCDVERAPHKVKEYDNFFCSDDCYGQWRSENVSGPNHPQFQSVETDCSNCGETITRQPHEVEMRDNLYCSMDCRAEDLSGTGSPLWTGASEEVETQCDQCGTLITRRRYILEKRERSFCSSECQGEWFSENWVGEDNPRWEEDFTRDYGDDWYVQRQKAIERDGYQCQDCGMTQDEHYDQWDQALHVHHITPIRTFEDTSVANQLDNLITVCKHCHIERETN